MTCKCRLVQHGRYGCTCSMPKAVANRAKPLGWSGDIDFSLSRTIPSGRLQHADDFRSWHARGNGIHRAVAHCAIAVNDKDCRFGNPTLVPRIIDIPLLYHAPFCITQNRKRQVQLKAQLFRFFRRIHRNGHDTGPGGVEFMIMPAVIRQLAETERSPMSAIEEQHDRAS